MVNPNNSFACLLLLLLLLQKHLLFLVHRIAHHRVICGRGEDDVFVPFSALLACFFRPTENNITVVDVDGGAEEEFDFFHEFGGGHDDIIFLVILIDEIFGL